MVTTSINLFNQRENLRIFSNFEPNPNTRRIQTRRSNQDLFVLAYDAPTTTPAPLVEQARRYIQNNSQILSDVLSRSLQNANFILVGEQHIRDNALRDSLSSEIVTRLNREVSSRNETLIVAFELHHGFQEAVNTLDLKQSNNALRRRLHEVTGFSENHDAASYFDMIIRLRRAGIRVVCIDDYPPDTPPRLLPIRSDVEPRDRFMFSRIRGLRRANPNARILFFGGAHHTSTIPITLLYDREPSATLGSLIRGTYGANSVISFRSADRYRTLNGEIPRDNIRVRDVIPRSQRGIIVIPQNSELFRPRSGQHDFIIINSVNEEYDRR